MAIFRRSFLTLVSLLVLLILVFFLSRLTGDPSYLFLPVNATPEARAAFAQANGFDQPLVTQFITYVQNMLTGDFGTSLRQQRPAIDIALEAFPITLKLAGVTLAIAIAGALVMGSLAAWKPRGLVDRTVGLTSLAGASAPDFWVAITLVLIFSVSLGILPTSGMGGIAYWILPVIVLGLRPFGLLVQVVRGAMIAALSSPYVKTARAKGASETRVIFVHALRNSMLPVITVAGDIAASLMNGAVIVETIFGWPGIGGVMINAILQRDFAVIQATILVTAIAILILNIVVDLLYGVLDPRVRAA
ncbi:ABC transporter permease [Paracoccus laeviglucosivorans]|uniref:Peptide/nickel transport system permease protein n=1 Tax=Paracoccus laeviglucosivorans TaxID=1197861 RepID=A0A521FBD0_9RHOB|nr:ABC transporter permease [Paracoccus laeviglucosivorans]SMO93453.1 peptide/nickel transport system permease protein [Paracoccus laeviglucosivorans]